VTTPTNEELKLIFEPTPDELAAMLFRVTFPRGVFADLPASVRRAYRLDAIRLGAMLREGMPS
jgi:hypothetical protein